jgi:Uri superfamily endonuclease
MKGSYSLIIEAPDFVEAGSLGKIEFNSNYLVYNGSAFGPGGLEARISRHLADEKSLHWHIDYLLEGSDIRKILIFPGQDLECDLSREMDSGVKGFGSSDCSCFSHLHGFNEVQKVFGSVFGVSSDFKVVEDDRDKKKVENSEYDSFEDFVGELPGPESYKES